MNAQELKIKYGKLSNLAKWYDEIESNENLNIKHFLNRIFGDYRGRRYLQDIIDLIASYGILFTYVCDKTHFLDEHYLDITIAQRLYHLWFNDYSIHICKICGSPAHYKAIYKLFKEPSKCYKETCASKVCSGKNNYQNTLEAIKVKYGEVDITNISQTKLWREKVKAGNLDKYGTEWHTQSKDFKDKAQETCLDKYGVEHHLKDPDILKKQSCTNLERYGVEWGMQVEATKLKSIRSFNDNYGVDNASQVPEIQQRKIITNQGRYGVDWYTQTDHCQLTNNNWKWYELPSSKMVHIQGYENKFLDEYFKNAGEESNLCIEGQSIRDAIGMIWYNTPDGKKHRYFPDFYLIEENKIIEVKSEWTYNIAKEINELKKAACLAMGLEFEFKIY